MSRWVVTGKLGNTEKNTNRVEKRSRKPMRRMIRHSSHRTVKYWTLRAYKTHSEVIRAQTLNTFVWGRTTCQTTSSSCNLSASEIPAFVGLASVGRLQTNAFAEEQTVCRNTREKLGNPWRMRSRFRLFLAQRSNNEIVLKLLMKSIEGQIAGWFIIEKPTTSF